MPTGTLIAVAVMDPALLSVLVTWSLFTMKICREVSGSLGELMRSFQDEMVKFVVQWCDFLLEGEFYDDVVKLLYPLEVQSGDITATSQLKVREKIAQLHLMTPLPRALKNRMT